MIIPVFLPHAGCPERCNFCDQRVSGGEPVPPGQIARTIEEFLATGDASVAHEVAFYGGTFTALSRERQLQCLEAVRPYLASRRIGAVRVATRPDSPDTNDEQWLARLREEYGLRTVELGVQSFNPLSLAALGRTHSPESALTATAALRRVGLRVGWHLMVGCPGESAGGVGDDDATKQRVLAARPDMVRIHPLLVIEGTALERLWRAGGLGEWKPLELEAAVSRSASLVSAFEAAGITVIRIGLQANELLGAAVVAGPNHPALGDLVRGRILRDQAETALAAALGDRIPTDLAVELELPERLVGTLRGPGSENLAWLAQRFKVSRITARSSGAAVGKCEARVVSRVVPTAPL